MGLSLPICQCWFRDHSSGRLEPGPQCNIKHCWWYRYRAIARVTEPRSGKHQIAYLIHKSPDNKYINDKCGTWNFNRFHNSFVTNTFIHANYLISDSNPLVDSMADDSIRRKSIYPERNLTIKLNLRDSEVIGRVPETMARRPSHSCYWHISDFH